MRSRGVLYRFFCPTTYLFERVKEIRKKERAEAKAKEREELIRATEIRVRREDAAARAAAAVGSSHAAVLPRSPPLNYGNDDAIRPRSKDKRRKDEGRNEPQGKIDSSAAAVAAARHACSPMALSSATATSSRELSSCSRTSSTGGVTSSREVSSGTVTSSTSSTSTAALAAARHASWGAEQANDIPRSSKAPGGGNRKFGRDKRHGESRPKSNTPSERIIIDRQRPRDSANVVRQRIPNITRTKSALADRLNPCPVLRFGPPEDRDIELYIGLEPIMCFKLHSRMVFGNALVLERGISGTLETTTAGRKYRTVLVVDGCNQPRFWAAHKFNRCEVASLHDAHATARFKTSLLRILEVWYTGKLTNVENVLEAAIEAQNLHCLGSVSDSFALALVEVPGALSLAIFSAPIEYLKLGCQLQSPTIFREAYAHVVGRWINPNDTIRDSVLPRDIVKLIRNEKKRTLDLYAVVRSKLIELQRVGPCQMTAVREVLRRHVAKARSAYGMQGQEGARCLAFAREPIILRSEVTRYERHKVHRDKRPRKRDLSKSTPGHFLSSSTESGSSDSSAGFPPTLQQAVAEHLLEIRQVLKPLLINQTNLRNGARDIDWSLSLDAEGLTAKGWPATEDGNRDADRSWLKPPDLWVAKNGRSVSIRYLLCAKIDDVDLPWIGVER